MAKVLTEVQKEFKSRLEKQGKNGYALYQHCADWVNIHYAEIHNRVGEDFVGYKQLYICGEDITTGKRYAVIMGLRDATELDDWTGHNSWEELYKDALCEILRGVKAKTYKNLKIFITEYTKENEEKGQAWIERLTLAEYRAKQELEKQDSEFDDWLF